VGTRSRPFSVRTGRVSFDTSSTTTPGARDRTFAEVGTWRLQSLGGDSPIAESGQDRKEGHARAYLIRPRKVELGEVRVGQESHHKRLLS
jgi:hypothetical protein